MVGQYWIILVLIYTISKHDFKEELIQLFYSRSFRKQNTRQELKCQQLIWEVQAEDTGTEGKAPETTRDGKQCIVPGYFIGHYLTISCQDT